MAARQKKDNFMETIKSVVADALRKNIGAMLKGQLDMLVAAAQAKVQEAESRIMKILVFLFFMAAGIVFLALSLTNYFIEILNLPKTIGFLIVGLLLMAIGGALKLASEKPKNKR